MDMDSRVTQLENQMQQVRTETAMGTYGAQTASARAEVDGYGWFFNFDVLYWHAKVGGTEFAYTDQDPRAQLPVKGRTKDIDFEWDWGIRVGLGYNFEHDGWDLRGHILGLIPMVVTLQDLELTVLLSLLEDHLRLLRT